MTPRWSNRLRVVALVAVGLVMLGGAGVAAKWLLSGSTVPMPRKIQTITRVSLPPPPPPPPPPPLPPPQAAPPKEEIKQKLEQPKAPDPTPKPIAKSPDPPKAAPPGNPLTAEAGNGPSNYGLGVGNGGGDTIGGGGGGGAEAKLVYASYARSVADQIEAGLKRDDRTRGERFVISVDVWLTPDGQVSRTRIVESSGDPTVDAAVLAIIGSQGYGRQPEGMPHRITFKTTARPA
jgi:TonB family protein